MELRIKLSMNKSAYLLILMLISTCFFHFTPISAFTRNDFCIVLFLLWLFAGHFMYNRPENYSVLTLDRRLCWPLALVWGGVLISFFAANALYGQGLFTSLVASRSMLSFLALPALGLVSPGVKDIERAAVTFSVILLAFSIMDALGIPVIDREFFIDPEKPKELIDEGSFVMLLPGFQWVPISLFFFLDRLGRSLNLRDFLGAVFFIAGVFLLQNRTILIASALPFAYVLFTIKGSSRRQTVYLRFGAAVVALGLIAFTLPQWIKLFSETATDLGNDDYNRILAYNYFFKEACPSPVYYLTGTGFISANVNSIMQDLMEVGIYNSDVGFVGFWNYYGILPIVCFIILIIKGFRASAPYFLKFNAFLILVGSATVACFDTMDKILWLCVYVLMLYKKEEYE